MPWPPLHGRQVALSAQFGDERVCQVTETNTNFTECEAEWSVALRYFQTCCRHMSPGYKGSISKQPIMDGLHAMASDPKEMVDGAVYREKALNLSWRLKSAHLPFPRTCGLV